jgi:signal transduction histidine kinase
VTITIAPPFWKTWWFITLSIAISAYGLYTFLRHKRRVELAQINERKREEIHQLQLQFFTNISHEFRTPLSLILGPIEQLLKKDHNSLFTQYYHTINRNAQRLMQLISELMDFRKVESGALKLKVTEGNFSVFVEDITREFTQAAEEKNIAFTVEQEHEFVNLYFDRQIVEKILLNLIHNALKYTPESGTVSVRITSSRDVIKTTFEGSLELENSYKGHQYVYITVIDTGIGISKESIHHLFERYYRITHTHLGSGIGLAFVKSLTLLHKGSIYVKSERHNGTCITIAIPVSKEDYTKDERWIESADKEGVQLESVPANSNLSEKRFYSQYHVTGDTTSYNTNNCILIVEDNDELRSFLRDILEPFYYVIDAVNGEEGLLRPRMPRRLL